jgi:hypothetical protein
MDSLTSEVKAFVLTREAESPVDAAKHADLFYSVIAQNSDRNKEIRKPQVSRASNDFVSEKKFGLSDGSVPTTIAKSVQEADSLSGAAASAVKGKGACFICGSMDHKKFQCPQNKTKFKPVSGMKQPNALVNNNRRLRDEEMFVIPMFIKGNARPIIAYRDTGSFVSLVNSAYVKKHEYTGNQIEVSGLFGPSVHIPTARIQVKSPKFQFEGFVNAEVGVVETTLPFGADVLLGNGIFASSKHIRDIISVDGVGLLKHRWSDRVSNAHADVSSAVDPKTDSHNDTLCQLFHAEKPSNALECGPAEAPGFQQMQAQTGSESSRSVDVSRELLDCLCKDLSTATEANGVSEVNAILYTGDAGLLHTDRVVQDSCSEQRSDSSPCRISSRLSVGVNRSDEVSSQQLTPHNASMCDSSGTCQTIRPTDVLCDVPRCDVKIQDASVSDEFTRLALIDPAVVNDQFYEQPTDKQMELANLQRSDPKLKPAWHKASLGKGGFIVRSGLLMKKRPVNVFGDNEYVLVLPDCKKRQVLVAAHDDPRSGGHVGFRRTYQKISRVFYMPKREIKQFCVTCIECQRLKPKCINERVDYVIPAIEEEFGRTWIIDVMGPTMERMSRKLGGHAHILVCIEAATRWVELIALPSLKATALAAAIESNLIARFACRKLVYDLQSGLMSDLMQSVLKLLRVNSYVSVAGFHSRTAVAERYCRTVERYMKTLFGRLQGKMGTFVAVDKLSAETGSVLSDTF